MLVNQGDKHRGCWGKSGGSRGESMTVQIAAASKALVLGAERRRDGRWIGWTNKTLQNSAKSRGEQEADRCAGLILDILGRDALRAVRDKAESLNAVYERTQVGQICPTWEIV